MRRLRRSVDLLVRVNRMRRVRVQCRDACELRTATGFLMDLEAALEQSDSDARQKVDPRQLGLFSGHP
jgi:hypothetical protein